MEVEPDRHLDLQAQIAARKRRLAAQRARRQPEPDRPDGVQIEVPNVEETPDEWRSYVALTSPLNPFNREPNNPLRNAKGFYSDASNRLKFPILRRLALKFLSAPASEASCEKIFSALKIVVGTDRQSLKPDVAEVQSLLKLNSKKIEMFNFF